MDLPRQQPRRDTDQRFPQAEGLSTTAARRERLCVVGVGRIGAVTAVGLAHLEHVVTGIDTSERRVLTLGAGRLFEAEPGLRAALRNARRFRTLSFTNNAQLEKFDYAFLCVDTPPLPSGEPDLRQVFTAAGDAARFLNPDGILVTRSTVPVGTGDRLAVALAALGRPDVAVVHVPEFLREGRAWEDFREPDRLVIGGNDPRAVERVRALFAAISCPIIVCDRRSAEMAKYAANAFLATSISFANEMSDLSEGLGADASVVFEVLRADPRIGRKAYLSPGLGFGGHCLPKDSAALEHMAIMHGRPAAQLHSTRMVNQGRVGRAVAWLRAELGGLEGRRVCIAGLSFKRGTDDLRESPSLNLARSLALEGAVIAGWDPGVASLAPGYVELVSSLDQALTGADAFVIAHDCLDALRLAPAEVGGLMHGVVIFDAPGLLDVSAWSKAGFRLNRPPKSHPGPASTGVLGP
ncbi:MAG: nucleotide sugar dehydrogenase [Dehalococcoidia bacterium]|nr:nucleotide sugar dehydrogenase [Dehalococcoidia bacterium]